ncbi:MAG: PQQ-binding-like beta-propeller repeat protein [Planctomycetaceae bacterium]|nr:PQQ-binding-like beta-propeller repeat protein [Planctomycetaceae bacterium]
MKVLNRRAGLVPVIGLICIVGAGVVLGQLRPSWLDDRDELSQFIPQNRRMQVLLDQAREQLKQAGDVQPATLQLLQFVIDSNEDAFTNSKLDSSLRQEAETILSTLPAQGLRLYQETYGGEAKALLQEARKTGSGRQKREIVHRFFMTEAGGDAAFDLAVAEMDRGELIAAALWFDRLRTMHPSRSQREPELSERTVLACWRAGMQNRAADILLAAVNNGLHLFKNDQPTPTNITTRVEAVTRLQQQLGAPEVPENMAVAQWLIQGGADDHNASVRPSTPVFDDAWRTSVIGLSEARTETRLVELQAVADSLQAFAEQESELQTFPVSEPLVVGETILFSSYGRLKAVDAKTGSFRWQAADTDPVFEYLLAVLGNTSGPTGIPVQGSIRDFLAQRAWLDATSASLSSDGERVYQVFNCGMVGPFHDRLMAENSNNHPLSPQPYNRLRAYDIPTEGKLLWEIGGPNSRVSLPLAGTFFLGAPLPVDGLLFVLGEDRGQVRLFALEPDTGEARWTLPLLNASSDVNNDLNRRLAGLSPAYAGGLLICPTGGGLIVAVDPVQRTLVWGHRYNTIQQQPFDLHMRRGFPPGSVTTIDMESVDTLLAEERWYGPSTVIADRSVLIAPPDQAVMHCLNLEDGKARWSRPRQRTLSLGGVHRGSVLLIGERSLEAVDLESGNVRWSLPIDSPGGRGVREGDLYHLPLKESRIATIDLTDGRLLVQSPMRTGAELGNLVAVNGRLFTQNTTDIRGFRSLAELDQQLATDLAANPNDPAALAVRGEMRLHAGLTSEGLEDLRTSLAAVADDRTQQLVVDTLLERLRGDFAANQEVVPELERLADDPVQRIRLLRTMATGLESIGKTQEAFQRYLQLMTFDDIADTQVHLNDTHTVRLDRWVQGQLLRLYDAAPAVDREELDRQLEETVQAAVSAKRTEILARFLSAFDRHPASELAENSLSEFLDPEHAPLRAEALYLRRRQQGTTLQRANATARLIRLYAEHDQGLLVRSLLDELASEFADVETWEGMTGAEVAEAWSKDEQLVEALDSVIDWPNEPVNVTKSQFNTRQFPMPLRRVGPIDPLLHAGVIMLHPNAQLSVYDGDGQMEDPIRVQSGSGLGLPDSNYARLRGHRTLIFNGQQFQLLNLLTRNQPKTILEGAVIDLSRQTVFGGAVVRPQQARRGLRADLMFDQGNEEYFGSIGPVGDDVFCYEQGGTLTAVDPCSGDELWHVDDVRRGCEIFADDEYIVLVSRGPRTDPTETDLYRAADGEFLGTRELPRTLEENLQDADWGRLFLTRQREAEGVSLAMYDPVTDRNIWERTFPGFIAWMPLDGQKLVVVEKDGSVNLLRAEDGEILFETNIDVPDDVRSMSVLGLPDMWILFTNRRGGLAQNVTGLLPQQARDVHVANGIACAFDRRTNEQLWSREIPRQIVDPSLPGRWPMLVLASGFQSTDGQSRNQYLELMLLDKHTGETLFEGEGDGTRRGISWSVSPEEPEMQLSFGATDLNITFGEQKEPASTEDESASPRKRPVGRRPPLPAPPPNGPPDLEEN